MVHVEVPVCWCKEGWSLMIKTFLYSLFTRAANYDVRFVHFIGQDKETCPLRITVYWEVTPRSLVGETDCVHPQGTDHLYSGNGDVTYT
jgi:hypothetical protein